MIDNVFKNKSLTYKLTLKSIISLITIAFAIILPQIVHACLGSKGGMMLLPMYIPIVICSAVIGIKGGIITAILSPIISFLITDSIGSPMPNIYKLPYIIIELLVISLVMGGLSKKILNNNFVLVVLPLTSIVIARCLFLLTSLIFANVNPITFSVAISQVYSGVLGVVLIAVLSPVVLYFIKKALNNND